MAQPPTVETTPPLTAAEWTARLISLSQTDRARAMSLAPRARAEGATHPLVFQLLALDLKQAGRFEAAIVELGKGLQLNPDNVPLTNQVGFCLLELGRRQEAAGVFETAMKLDPASAEAAYGYGWTAERLGALEQAQSAWERAVRLDPNHADALAGLSGLAVRRRDWTVARDYAERAASLDPQQTDALMNLVRVEIGLGAFEEAEYRLTAVLALPHLNPLARAGGQLMLGDILDGQRRFGQAMDAYATGNADLRERHAAEFARPGVATPVDGVNRLAEEFRQSPPAAWAKAPRSTVRRPHAGHAFLMGFPRSGTTLLEQVLATHPDIVTLEERPALVKAELEFLGQFGGVRRLAHVVSDFLEPFREDYWRRVREFGVNPHGKVFVDKQPLNTFRLPLIAKVFPEAKIIFAIRDPRDVVLSCFRRSFNMNASMYQFTDLESAARYYAAVMEAGKIYLDTLDPPTFEVRYERLVTDFTATIQGLCVFLDVEWTERLKNFAETAQTRRIATPSSTQVGRGLYDEGMNQWRNYADALLPVLPILQPWIERFGYAPE